MPLQTTGNFSNTGRFGTVSSIYTTIERIQREENETSHTEEETDTQNFIVNPEKIEEQELSQITEKKYCLDVIQTLFIFLISLLFLIPGLICVTIGVFLFKNKLILGLSIVGIGMVFILIWIILSFIVVITRRSKYGSEYFYMHLVRRKRIKSELNQQEQ
jgi:4-amino-4-deoxy-L-arabinose transferase-like glycosyltransferase